MAGAGPGDADWAPALQRPDAEWRLEAARLVWAQGQRSAALKLAGALRDQLQRAAEQEVGRWAELAWGVLGGRAGMLWGEPTGGRAAGAGA